MASARTDNFLIADGGQGIEVRFVYPYLGKKRDRDWQNKPIDPKEQWYEVQILIPKASHDLTTPPFVGPRSLVPKVWEAWCALPGVNGQWKQGARWPILDCDIVNPPTGGGRPETEPYAKDNPWARGNWRINASTKYPVTVVGPDNAHLTRDVYENLVGFKGGDYGLVSVHAFAYATGTSGVSFGLEGVKKLRDGDAIGAGQRTPEQMFGGAPAPAAAPPIPQGYGAPAPAYAPQAPQPNFTPQSPAMPPSAPPAYGQPAPSNYAPAPGYATSSHSSGAPVHGGAPSFAPPAFEGMPPQPPVPFGSR
jgi:hypothetical protein